MRKVLLTLVGCLLLVAGYAQQDARRTGKSTAGAHLHLQTTNHDFGDVPRKGGDLVYDFVFTNDGTVPLVVTRVLSTCSCLKTSFSKRPVPPGGKGMITIIYEPHKSDPGVFNKVIQIFSNSTPARNLVTVQGNSIDKP